MTSISYEVETFLEKLTLYFQKKHYICEIKELLGNMPKNRNWKRQYIFTIK